MNFLTIYLWAWPIFVVAVLSVMALILSKRDQERSHRREHHPRPGE